LGETKRKLHGPRFCPVNVKKAKKLSQENRAARDEKELADGHFRQEGPGAPKKLPHNNVGRGGTSEKAGIGGIKPNREKTQTTWPQKKLSGPGRGG